MKKPWAGHGFLEASGRRGIHIFEEGWYNILMKLFEYFRYVQDELFSFPAIGLDISDESFHFVKAQNRFSGKPVIEYFGEEAVPSGMVQFGEIRDEAGLARILKGAFARLRHVHIDPFVVAALPEEKAFVKSIQVPPIEDPQEMENAIRFEAETSIPLSSDEMYFDYQDITPEGVLDHRDVMVLAYPKNIVNSYTRVLREAGFQIAAFELESQAVIRALLNTSAEPDPFLIIDIGRTKSGFSIVSDGYVMFASTMPLGGRDFEKAIQDALSIDQQALYPMITAITDEARKNIDFFDNHPRHSHGGQKSIKRIILCGGDSYLFGFPEELSMKAGIAVEYGKALQFFSEKNSVKPYLSEHDSLLFATALGLGLRAIKR
jgi:type IV pilus assembly protein PilM